MTTSHGVRALALATISAFTGSTLAGELIPPGPPASTPPIEPRTAINQENTPGDASFLFRITEPGSYYAPGNLFNPEPSSPRNGILIEASDVTIDLCGFKLDGQEPVAQSLDAPPRPQGPAPPTTGILASGAIENITIRNGTIRDWTGDGMDLFLVNGSLLENLIVTECGGGGVIVSGLGVIRDCVIRSNGGRGLFVENLCTVVDNTIVNNSGGVHVGGFNNSVAGNTVLSNGAHGIRVGGAGSEENLVSDNRIAGGSIGILLDDIDSQENVVVGNTMAGTNASIDVGGGSSNNTILGNSGTGVFLSVSPTTMNPTGAWINVED